MHIGTILKRSSFRHIVDDTGLPKDSIAMAHQIRTIAKERRGEQCGCLKKEELRDKVRTAIKTYLDV